MKKLLYIFSIAAALLSVSCEKDAQTITVSEPSAPTALSANPDNITLSIDNTDALALTLVWKAGDKATSSDPTVALPESLVPQSAQFSSDAAFATFTEVSLESDATALQLTGAQLSQILTKLGLTESVEYEIYVRVGVSMNKKSYFCDAVKIKITPYAVETGIMNIVDKNDTEKVVATLRSSESDAELFCGFAATPGTWYNFYFISADGVYWGCDDSWTAYSLIAGSYNNCWFAEPAGCQYVFADTRAQNWWQVYLPVVTATASGTAYELKFSSSASAFSGTVMTAEDNACVTLSGAGLRYDGTTGDSASAGTEYPFSLAPDELGGFSFVSGSSDAALTIAKAGTYTLTLNVADCTWTLAEGGDDGGDEDGDDTDPWPADPDYSEASGDVLYISSVDSDKNPTEQTGWLLRSGSQYQGYFYFTSWYNFAFVDGASAAVYGSAPVDGGLYRLYCGASRWNIWYDSETAAYARVTVDCAERSWKYETVNTISIVGDFNSWSLDANQMVFDAQTGTWQCTVNAESWGTYGIHFVVNSDWDWCFTDYDVDGKLDIGKDDFMPAVSAGAYKITIDLNDPENMTIKFE